MKLLRLVAAVPASLASVLIAYMILVGIGVLLAKLGVLGAILAPDALYLIWIPPVITAGLYSAVFHWVAGENTKRVSYVKMTTAILFGALWIFSSFYPEFIWQTLLTGIIWTPIAAFVSPFDW